MATATTEAQMTAEGFFQWMLRPENKSVRYELVEGSPRLCPLTADLDPWRSVVDVLQRHVLGRGVGSLALRGDGLILTRNPDTVMTPDLMLFLQRAEPHEFPKQYTEEVPELVVEILSPTTTLFKARVRAQQYLAHGVAVVWIIDPIRRTASVLRCLEPQQTLGETETLTGNGVLPDFSCKVAELFALPGPPPG